MTCFRLLPLLGLFLLSSTAPHNETGPLAGGPASAPASGLLNGGPTGDAARPSAWGSRRPDEGEWLPTQFRGMDWSELRKRGLELTKDEFWHPEKGGVLSAAVQINGCTASFISEDGLLITNHHCGFGAINRLSTVDNNLVEKGFVAPGREGELPAPGMRVSILRRIEDVTAEIHAAQAKAHGDVERYEAVEDAKARLVREAEQRTPYTRCSISSFFDGRKYLLYYRTQLTDVRLVYAPPRSVGEFGGDEDNWMWPRHTGDFSIFRAYSAPGNDPAPYSHENVPYHPKHHLKISTRGVREGDLALILGYPGRTERYLTSRAVRSRQEDTYPLRLDFLTRVLEIYDDATKGHDELRLRLASRVKSIANVQKNAAGMVQGLRRNQVVAHKLREEAAFRRWVAAEPDRKGRYGRVLDNLLALDEEAASQARRSEIVITLLRQCPDLFNLAQLAYAAEEASKDKASRERGYKEAQLARIKRALGFPSSLPFETIQLRVLGFLMEASQALPAGQRIPVFDHFMKDAETSGEETAALIFADSPLRRGEERIAAYEKGWAFIEASNDPVLVLARGLAAELRDLRRRNRAQAGARLAIGSRWIEAQEAWRGASFYPDANSTLRISVCTVKGYKPFDGAVYLPFTTLAGVLEKETGKGPFKSPAALLAAARQADKGRFADPKLGDVPVCFLTDGDTTGGNSGSPLINGKGELVGLNFDRVFENVAGDYLWTAERSRNISVDIRYALWIMERVLPAPKLLKELGF